MGLDVKFFTKNDDGSFDEIAAYRNKLELLYWIKVNEFDKREVSQAVIDPNHTEELYDLLKVSKKEMEDLVDRAKEIIENDPKNRKFSSDHCLLPRGDVKTMDTWNNDELDSYLEDMKDYIETFETISEDVYVYLSY